MTHPKDGRIEELVEQKARRTVSIIETRRGRGFLDRRPELRLGGYSQPEKSNQNEQ